MPQKKYHVDLTDEERAELEKMLKGGKHKSRKLTRARILLLADAGNTDAEIVSALHTARPTVERTRQRFVEQGLGCLNEQLRMGARPRLTTRQQAHLIAVACTEAPDGRARWTLQLLADKAVELKFVDWIAPTNRKFSVPGCAFHQIQGGKIAHLWAYWDTATLMRQLGVLPRPSA